MIKGSEMGVDTNVSEEANSATSLCAYISLKLQCACMHVRTHAHAHKSPFL